MAALQRPAPGEAGAVLDSRTTGQVRFSLYLTLNSLKQMVSRIWELRFGVCNKNIKLIFVSME